MAIEIRQLRADELDDADRTFRLAFGTFLGLPDPLSFSGDSDYVRTRWRADPSAAFVAVERGNLLGTNFVTRWGSFGFFGPLSVRPDLWDRGVAKRLLDATMECFERGGVRHRGLFTFAQSAKHVGLYQRFGFFPRFLTAVMIKAVSVPPGTAPPDLLSTRHGEARAAALAECGRITGAVFPGLELAGEIRAVREHDLGDTVLLIRDEALHGFAVCHVGAGTEAGSGACYVKFGVVRPGSAAPADFDRLLDACERFAAARAATQLVAGVNTGREAAYRHMLARGFRTAIQGVAMQSPNEPGFNRPDCFVIDDWR